MKISSISNDDMDRIDASQHDNKPVLSSLANAVHASLTKWDQMNIAITLSEAGDVEGAKAILSKRDK